MTPYWIEYLQLNAQARDSFIQWLADAEKNFAAAMQQFLLTNKIQEATTAALKLSIYQEIAAKFKTEDRERTAQAEYAEKQKGGN